MREIVYYLLLFRIFDHQIVFRVCNC